VKQSVHNIHGEPMEFNQKFLCKSDAIHIPNHEGESFYLFIY